MADQLEARLAELEAERERVRGAFARFGEVLARTRREQLLRVMVETAVEATGAAGAALVDEPATARDSGDIEPPRIASSAPLRGRLALGTLILVGERSRDDARRTANSLAAQSVVALTTRGCTGSSSVRHSSTD